MPLERAKKDIIKMINENASPTPNPAINITINCQKVILSPSEETKTTKLERQARELISKLLK